MTTILKGSSVAQALALQIANKTNSLKVQNVIPQLACVRVGERDDDIAYERAIIRNAQELGVKVKRILLPAAVTQEALLAEIQTLNTQADVHGVLIFSPLPSHLNQQEIDERLAPNKDVDGITAASRASLYADSGAGFAPCTPLACMEIFDHYGIELAGKHVVVVGRSLVVGKPLAMLLLKKNATVSICHSKTKNLSALVKSADIVVACVGKAHFIEEHFLAENQVLVDVGINCLSDGSIVGDVDFAAALDRVAAITPVPGGVGSVTTKVLLNNVVTAAQNQLP